MPQIRLIGCQILGLSEAIRVSQRAVCGKCNYRGSTLACSQIRCREMAHFPCGQDMDWTIDEDNFLSRCHLHSEETQWYMRRLFQKYLIKYENKSNPILPTSLVFICLFFFVLTSISIALSWCIIFTSKNIWNNIRMDRRPFLIMRMSAELHLSLHKFFSQTHLVEVKVGS